MSFFFSVVLSIFCVWRVLGEVGMPCVRSQNPRVKTQTSPCVPAPRPNVLTHAGVVPVRTRTC